MLLKKEKQSGMSHPAGKETSGYLMLEELTLLRRKLHFIHKTSRVAQGLPTGKLSLQEHPVSTQGVLGCFGHEEEARGAPQGAGRLTGRPCLEMCCQAAQGAKTMLKTSSEPDSLLGANNVLSALFYYILSFPGV